MVTSLLYIRRYLTLALLLLTFVSGAWGDDFIHYKIYGSTDDWKISDALKYKVVADNIGSVIIHLEVGVYEFFFKQPDKTFNFASPIEVVDGNVYLLTERDKHNGKLTVATPGDYTFTVKWDGSKPSIRVDFPEDPSADKSFYLIVPNENVGNTERAVPASKGIAPKKHTAFKLTAGRERNKSELNEDLVSINLKIDGDKGQQLRYDKNGEIRFYIKQGEKSFRPQDSENVYIIGEGADNKKIMATNGVDFYGIRSHSMTQSATDKYYTIHKNNAGDTKSLTFMFSKNNGLHNFIIDGTNTSSTNNGNAVNGFKNNGNLIVGFLQSRGYNSKYYNEHISNGNVYLIGQMGENYTSDTNYPMTKITYPKDAPDDEADSIVYVCEVKKGSNSWDNFFLSFSTGDKIGNENKHWNLLLRPHVQDQMDGQSLEGGVFFFKDDEGTDNQQQALNPLLSDDQKKRYVSYKVYFNATYSTYRIEFYDKFCIAGPAVNGIENDNTNDSKYFQPEHRKAMQTETHHGVTHYKYTGEFKQGSTFAFFVNPETYVYNYSEDDDVADEAQGDMWSTQAPADKNDYAFHNHIRWNKNGDNEAKSLGTSNNGILWTLPSGTYTLRLYYHAEEANHNQLITIDKVVKLKNATSEFAESEGGTKESHNYGGWRTFSDDCALWLPNGVRAFYVSEVTSESKARLAEVTDGIIPAHCGVLLYDENLLEGEEEIHLYPVPTDYSKTLTAETTNLLVDCYKEDKTVQPTEGDRYNYFFTCFYKKIGDRRKSNVPMNFWKTVENANAKKNYTYLSVDKNIHPVAFDSDHCNYLQELLASNIANNAKNYCFLFSLDDTFGGDTTTAIEVPEDIVCSEKEDAWFNMQGIRISKPNTPGLYIHNRKKVVIR